MPYPSRGSNLAEACVIGRRIAPSTLEQWRREAPRQRAKSAKVVAALGPIRRDKPRNRAEAELLRDIGTPERLIGPEA